MVEKKHVNPTKSDSKSSTSPSNKKTNQFHPSYSTPYDRIMYLQRTIGNRAVGQLHSSGHLQAKPGDGGPIQKERNEALSEEIQTKLETYFSQGFSNVAIQKNSQKASDINSLAFTQGDNISFAPGQFNPNSEKGKNLIGHEFAHVVQQRSGVVKPTSVLGKGLTVNDDKGLEHEADNFGKSALRGETIAKYQSSSLGIRSSLRTAQMKSNVIQMAVNTWGGTWDTDRYNLLTNKDSRGNKYVPRLGVRGIDTVLKFTPGTNADAKKIGLTQTVQDINRGTPSFVSTTERDRAIKSKDAIPINTGRGETDEGTAIDRLKTRNNPIYGSPSLTSGQTLEDTPMDNNPTTNPTVVGTNASYQLGYRYKTGSTWNTKDAMLSDAPFTSNAAKNTRQIFETTALALKGSQKNMYYGSVRWGWRTDSASKHTKIPLTVVSQGVPSSTFMKAAELWNASKTSTGANTVNLPIKDVKLISNPAGVNIGLGPIYTHLPVGTRVVEMPGFPSMTDTYIRVVDGPYTGETGTALNSDLADERN